VAKGAKNVSEDKLAKLIAQGPCPKFSIRALVIGRFHEIQQARQFLWGWGDIAVALDLDKGRGKEISAAFRRVDAAIKSGNLKIQKNENPDKKRKGDDILASRQRNNSTGIVNLDDPKNQL
jgi:hypothetical protein